MKGKRPLLSWGLCTALSLRTSCGDTAILSGFVKSYLSVLAIGCKLSDEWVNGNCQEGKDVE